MEIEELYVVAKDETLQEFVEPTLNGQQKFGIGFFFARKFASLDEAKNYVATYGGVAVIRRRTTEYILQ